MLALLDRFQSALQDFAGREEQLNGEFRTRTSAETKAFEAATQQQAARLSERIADAETGLAAERKNYRAKFEKRKARITQAHLTCTRQVMEGTDAKDAEAPASDKLNGSGTQTGRRPGQCRRHLGQFQIKLAASREIFVLLEKRPAALFALRQIPQTACSAPAMAGTESSPG